MRRQKTLIIDDEVESLRVILSTLEDAQVPFINTATTEAAWQAFQEDSDISLVLLRLGSQNIDSLDLCQRIRSVRGRNDLSIIIILDENQLSKGAEALIAGASDLLIAPFEPRELRMRGNIVPPDQERRVDQAHTVAELSPELASEPQLFLPSFEPATLKVGFGKLNGRVEQWKADADTKQITVDRIIVCPECEAIPTFRPGCGACGSAFVEQEILIHHFACAHVGPETEFRGASGLVCPKCRLTDLIAGSDFEQIMGCLRCSDCEAIMAEPKSLGHCLSCQNRFLAEDGKLVDVVGYQVGISASSAFIAPPNFQTAESRKNSTRTV